MSFQLYPREGSTNTAAMSFEVIVCCTCHIPFAVTSSHKKELHRTKAWFYCPAGHHQHYVKSTEQELREDIAKKESEIERQRTRTLAAQQEAELAKKREEIATGETRRIMKRVTSGVCPCCNRTLQNLARHMATKHPESEHAVFAMTDYERRTLAAHPTWSGARAVRQRFVKAHIALADDEIARLMIDGKLYASPHVPTVARAVANIRKSLP